MMVAFCGGALQAQETLFEELATPNLPNAIRVHARVISGGQPAGPEGFQELKALGVKTIISVDAAAPDARLARQFGMRYVHLPHGYDGIPASRVSELAKALRELEGPIYIHCHHGQHRSPAATAVGCVTAGLIAPQRALELLAQAGTSPQYRGLYRSVKLARPVSAAELDALQIQFHARVEVPPLADAMVSLEHTLGHLKSLAAAGWQANPKHPDITAAHESLLLREQYVELLRTDDTAQRPAAYRQLLQEAQRLAGQLENFSAVDVTQNDRAGQLSTVLKRIEDNCRTCHAQFRDNPAGQERQSNE